MWARMNNWPKGWTSRQKNCLTGVWVFLTLGAVWISGAALLAKGAASTLGLGGVVLLGLGALFVYLTIRSRRR